MRWAMIVCVVLMFADLSLAANMKRTVELKIEFPSEREDLDSTYTTVPFSEVEDEVRFSTPIPDYPNHGVAIPLEIFKQRIEAIRMYTIDETKIRVEDARKLEEHFKGLVIEKTVTTELLTFRYEHKVFRVANTKGIEAEDISWKEQIDGHGDEPTFLLLTLNEGAKYNPTGLRIYVYVKYFVDGEPVETFE